MANAEVTDIAPKILPAGVRPNKEQINEIQEIIDSVPLAPLGENATYIEHMDQKQNHIEKILEKLENPKPKSKPKAKAKSK